MTQSLNLDDQQSATLALSLCNIGICDYCLPPNPTLKFSAAWARIIGYKPEEIPSAEIFQSWWGQQIHPNDHERIINLFNKLYSGELKKISCSFYIKNRQKVWCEVEVFATIIRRDKQGRAQHVFTVMRDIRSSENVYKRIVENLNEGLWVIDRQGFIRFVNQVLADMLGFSIDEMLGKLVFEYVNKENKSILHAQISERKKGLSSIYEMEVQHKNESAVLIQLESAPLFDSQGRFDGVVEGVRDMTEAHSQQLKLKMLSSAVEQSGSMVIITDQETHIEYVNPKLCSITRYTKSELIGKSASIFRVDDIDMEMVSDMWANINSGYEWQGEVQLRKKDGESIWVLMSISSVTDEKNKISHFVVVCEDVSQLKEARLRMEELAYVDGLTGLANRLLFRDRLEQVLNAVQRSGGNAALLYMDLDEFKRINDSLGHDVGDAVLMKVAESLRQCVRHQDTVARMGGDEFVILLSDIDGMSGASSVAIKILNAMQQPVKLLKNEILITSSIGITLAPDDSLNADILLKNADMAMYRAKSSGKNNYQFFTEEMNTQIVDHMTIESDLRRAIDNDELYVKYQPQFSIKDKKISGVEALVRWDHPTRGELSPEYFIPIAETAGLMVKLGKWVLRVACKEIKKLESQGLKGITLAVNLSTRQFRDPCLIETIQNILVETDFKALDLELEITETTLMEQIDHAVELLEQIKALGISVTIDDFGTGYSSLNYLKRMPIDTLKIDKAFIMDIPQDKDDMEISAAVIAMAHKLGLQVVAEGVSSEDHWAFLEKNNCDIAQGYLMGKPMLPEKLLMYVSDKK
ncbi:diguanylate cyclase/phosphodiesterase (GGDEF & EAL domains) with PAS/PAC sensor(s) [hydrothermal vent metagenome]|uniref:Diguanylate cyclase/phosphodiesterase (GGDEF & EAL domains) with PAS/PAC sensor(S) n=1 Tax=hydrothermal vent metagenome TaxID=652676 RepID=A0A3B0XSV5_9ZZZZ